MPEGDTIFRAANSLRTWICGRVVTGFSTRKSMLLSAGVVGSTISEIRTHGKHLFIDFTPDVGGVPLVLRTHMMMSGSWHVYTLGQPWQRPASQAVVEIRVGERIAVCFNAPVVELSAKSAGAKGEFIRDLGPDILQQPLDVDAIEKRQESQAATEPVSVTILNQHVVSGVGNLYRSESLFLVGINPFSTRLQVSSNRFRKLVECAAELMHANLPPASSARTFGEGFATPWVYGRAQRPCRRCKTTIQTQRVGNPPRSVYWCPTCQPGEQLKPRL